jgi:hypothetical protein
MTLAGSSFFDTKIKKPRDARGFHRSLATTSFSSSPSSLLELSSSLPFLNSPPILTLFTTIAHLLPGKPLFKNIFKSCHMKIQSKNRRGGVFYSIATSSIVDIF